MTSSRTADATEPDVDIRTGQRVTTVARLGNGFALTTAAGLELRADLVVVAASARRARRGSLA